MFAANLVESITRRAGPSMCHVVQTLTNALFRIRTGSNVRQRLRSRYGEHGLALHPLPFFCPFLSAAAAAFWAVIAAYRSPFSHALALTSISRAAVSSIFHPQSSAVMHHEKSARLMSGPVLP